MVLELPSSEELLAERKEELFSNEIEGRKAQQGQVITRCNNEIQYCQAQITKLEQQRQDAQDLLDELETRYPTEIAEK